MITKNNYMVEQLINEKRATIQRFNNYSETKKEETRKFMNDRVRKLNKEIEKYNLKWQEEKQESIEEN